MKTPSEMTGAEHSAFQELDDTIRAGAKTFMEVGHALVKMHEKRLYRTLFKTFQEYTESRGIGRRQAYNLMQAVQLTLELQSVHRGAHDSNAVNIGNLNRASVKGLNQLGKVPREKRKEVFEKAASKTTGKIDSKAVIDAAAEVMHTEKPKPSPKPEPLANPVLPASIIPPEPVKENPQTAQPLTLARFKKLLDELEAMIPDDCDHTLFRIAANELVKLQMNFRKGRREFNPYSSA
jgi:hypothetical protein